MRNKLTVWLRALFRANEMEHELEEELRFHLECEIARNVERGMAPAEARNAALRTFGSVDRAKEECRDVRGVRWIETLWQDVRYGVRMLIRSPLFTAVAVIALALGIGANTAIFSVVNAVLLRPLPLGDPDRLVALDVVNVKSGVTGSGGAAPADFADWRAQGSSFEQMAAAVGRTTTLTGLDQPEAISTARVSDDFFTMVQVQPALGRAFRPEEFTTGGPRAVVLSYRFWQRRFAADPKVVGESLTLNGVPTTVVGVMPAEFKLPSYAEAWTPIARDTSEMLSRTSRYFGTVARLKPGVTIEQAQAEMSTLAGLLEQQHPESNTGWSVRIVPLRDSLVGSVRSALLILLGAVAFVLLIACANVANLLLSRASVRQREIAIRAALGATRLRLVRQLLTEGILLALLGGTVGLLLAVGGVELLTALVPKGGNFPRLDEIRVDERVLLFTVVVSLVTGMAFGLVPALHASKTHAHASLNEGGRGSSAGPRLQRTRNLLVVGEIALTFLLLFGAGLLIRSFVLLRETKPGFKPDNLLTLDISIPVQRYQREQQIAEYFQSLLDGVAAVPGVESAAMVSSVPLSGFDPLSFPFVVEGRPSNPDDVPEAMFSAISPNYFRTMEIPLRSGREFTDADRTGALDVAVINETMAHRFFADRDPIGQRIAMDYMDKHISLEIVGVVADTAQSTLGDRSNVEIYTSSLQHPWFWTSIVVRTQGAPAGFLPLVQRAIWSVDKDRPILSPRTMDQLLSESVAQPRFYTWLLGTFASLALILATVGIYGVISYSVAQRRHEIGIRMALGAQPSDVLRLVVGQGMALALAGVAIGLVAASVLSRVMTNLIYGISETDAVTLAGVSVLLAAVAALACYLPARRAARVDPVAVLKDE